MLAGGTYEAMFRLCYVRSDARERAAKGMTASCNRTERRRKMANAKNDLRWIEIRRGDMLVICCSRRIRFSSRSMRAVEELV